MKRGCRRAGRHLFPVQLVRDLHADLQACEVSIAMLHIWYRKPPVVGLADLPAGTQSAIMYTWLCAPIYTQDMSMH